MANQPSHTDTIRVKNLRFYGRHGILPEENTLGQHFLVSLALEIDLQPAGTSDDLERGIDYRKVIEIAKGVVEGTPVKLLETVAEKIAERTLEDCPQVTAVTVELGKANPPIDVDCSGIFVEIRRTRAQR